MSTTLTITRGDKRTFPWKMTVDKALAGATIRMMCRRTVEGAVVISKSLIGGVETGIKITSDVVGNRAFSTTLDGTDTATLNIKGETLLYDIELTYSDLDGPFTLCRGSLVVESEIVR